MVKIYEIAAELFNRTGDKKRMEDIIQNIQKPTYRNGKMIMGVVDIPIDMLRLPSYQKDRLAHIDESKVTGLAANYDIERAGYIEVIPNWKKGAFDICDGMGRVIGGEIAGVKYIAANVHLNIPEDQVETAGAKLFNDQSLYTRHMRPVQQHTARMILGDEDVLTLDKVTKAHGVYISVDPGKRDAGIPYIRSYNDALSIVKVAGAEGLDFAYRVIELAGWKMEKTGYCSYVLYMLKYSYLAWGKEKKAAEEMGKLLKNYVPSVFKAAAQAKYPARDCRSACALYLDDQLRAQYHKTRKRLMWTGNKLAVI